MCGTSCVFMFYDWKVLHTDVLPVIKANANLTSRLHSRKQLKETGLLAWSGCGRLFQRNRTDGLGLGWGWWGKELGHVLMEAGKSRTRDAEGIVSVWDPGELMVKFQCKSEGGRRPMSQLEDKAERKNSFLLRLLFYSGLQWTGWGSPMLGSAVCSALSTDSKANLIEKHPHGHTQNHI